MKERALGLSDMQHLYSQVIPFHIKTETTPLTLTITQSTDRPTTLTLQLTSSDPFFLYHLTLDDNDFQTLKSSQGLLIDFPSFPTKLIDLVDCCLQAHESNTNKFIIVLENGKVSIIETNTFKQIHHLVLQFTPGTDYTTKVHLASVVTELKSQKEKLQKQVADWESQYRHLETRSDESRKEWDMKKESLVQQLSEAKIQHAQTVSALKEDYAKVRDSERLQHEGIVASLKAGYEKELMESKQRIEEMRLESKEQKQRMEHASQQILFLTQDLTKAKADLDRASVEKDQQQILNHQLTKKNAELEQKVKELSSSTVQLESKDEQTKREMNKLLERIELLGTQTV
jgi:spindle assembly abnormal protein 6